MPKTLLWTKVLQALPGESVSIPTVATKFVIQRQAEILEVLSNASVSPCGV